MANFNKLYGYNSDNGANSLVQNADVVKTDIMREIKTKKGSYLNKPQYGTNIQSMIFEQMNNSNIQSIEQSIEDVFLRDGRATVKNMSFKEDKNTLIILVDFYYVNNYITDTLSINFDLTNQS